MSRYSGAAPGRYLLLPQSHHFRGFFLKTLLLTTQLGAEQMLDLQGGRERERERERGREKEEREREREREKEKREKQRERGKESL